MVQQTEQFHERLTRIQRGRRNRRGGMGFVVHADGVVTALGRPSSRLRFGFPLQGLLVSLALAVAVKAYLLWFLGTDVYSFEVAALVDGSNFERVAGMILQPDALSLWLAGKYEVIHAFIQAGLAANQAA